MSALIFDERFESYPVFPSPLPKIVKPLWLDEYNRYGVHPENLSTEVVYDLSTATTPSYAVSPDGTGLFYYDSYNEAVEEHF